MKHNLCTEYNVCFNFYSTGSLLVLVFTALVAIFLLSIKNRSETTTHLGLGFLMFVPFYAGYVFAASFYHPLAAYHRWLTVGFVLPALLHFTQFLFRYPVNSHPVVTKIFLYVQWLIIFSAVAMFVYATSDAGYQFYFQGHYWDFDADITSKRMSWLIIVYMFILIIVGLWKFHITKTKERHEVLFIACSILIAGLIPAIMNTLSRDGLIERSSYLISLVICALLIYFFIIVIYINSGNVKSTFMAKIVGISLLTFLLTLQFINTLNLKKEDHIYNTLKIADTIQATASDELLDGMEYLIKYDLSDNTIPLMAGGENKNILFENHKYGFLYASYYEKIKNLNDEYFRSQITLFLSYTDPEFDGYKNSLHNYLIKSPYSDSILKNETLQFIDTLNEITEYHYRKIDKLPDNQFRNILIEYLEQTGSDFSEFRKVIYDALKENPMIDGKALKSEVLRFIVPFQSAHVRRYRSSSDENPIAQKHFVSFMHFLPDENAIYEAGFSYKNYRAILHEDARTQKYILFGILFVVLFLFPLFFRGALMNPLRTLLDGVESVNKGNLNITVPVKVKDEIGFLADSFNRMTESVRKSKEQLEDYAQNLEAKVNERTNELNNTLNEIQDLKTQQDGDYYLTSLLSSPLNNNANSSTQVLTKFYLRQKKSFEYKNKKAELGGDICITGNLRIGTPDSYRRFTVIINGDAMGKSMQGAGGALVMGVVMNSIMARSARNDLIIDTTPESWLTEVYEELQNIFCAFNGAMAISAVISLIDDHNGMMYYFNAEHPPQIILRNFTASFIEKETQLRKIGIESEIPFQVFTFQLHPDDILFVGSDGRDDIDLTPGEKVRTLNEDHSLFMKLVEESGGNIDSIIKKLESIGEITDDLSLIRVGFQENIVRYSGGKKMGLFSRKEKRNIILIDPEIESLKELFQEYFAAGKNSFNKGKTEKAIYYLSEAYKYKTDDFPLNRMLSILHFRSKNYADSIPFLEFCLSREPELEDFWLYLSIACKKIENIDRALFAAETAYKLNPHRIPNLLDLVDIHIKLDQRIKAEKYLGEILEIDPKNKQAIIMQTSLNKLSEASMS